MPELKDTFTSTGHKFFAHTEAMTNLRNGKGQAIVTHLMPTDLCQHTCSFCSVATREGNVLPLKDMLAYLDILIKYGLRATIISGGGNPILYKCPETGKNFNDLVSAIYDRGLEIGLITNGMSLRQFQDGDGIRDSWGTVRPSTLDKCTWIRISMSGLDHEENEVYVPDIDPHRTTLGFSYVLHDSFSEPADTHHGKVSTPEDLITLGTDRLSLPPPRWANERIPELTEQIAFYVETYKPQYVRTTPNCLQPNLIPERCETLQRMADTINARVGYDPVFVQFKPPKAPKNCWIGYPHPVMNSDGFVYPCDAVVLAVAEVGYRQKHPSHQFESPWRICHWSEIGRIYEQPIRSLIEHPNEICRGCVFWQQQAILESVVDGSAEITHPAENPLHVNFV